MNILALLVGGYFAKRVIDGYPSEIRNLKNQLPESDREAFLGQYKKLSNKDKTSFKQALRNADIGAASQILGQDLAKYNVQFKKKTEEKPETAAVPPSGTDIVAKVNKILAVPTSIDPELVAEAARRYEEAVPSTAGMSITEKTKRLIEVSG